MSENILQEADRLTGGDRGNDYGHPLDDYERTSALWSAILGVPVTAEQAQLCMIAVKISRECNKHKRDNLTDIAGYARTLEMTHNERAARLARHFDLPNGAHPVSGVIALEDIRKGDRVRYRDTGHVYEAQADGPLPAWKLVKADA